jgi:hypothetical protein
VACRFAGRGKPGDDENGSNAGRSEGAGRFTPAVVGSEGSKALLVPAGEESIPIQALVMPIPSVPSSKMRQKLCRRVVVAESLANTSRRVRQGG